MVSLSFWVDVTAQRPEAWDGWTAIAVENVTVAPFGSLGDEPRAGGDRAWRWLQLLAAAAESAAPSTDWLILLPADTYVHIGALSERLACFDPGSAYAFGRLAGRIDSRLTTFGQIQVPVPILGAGVLFSRGALMLPTLRRLGAEICTVAEVSYFTSLAMREVGERSSSLDQVGFTVDDYAFAFCLAMARLPLPLGNFASYLDHFVLGRSVADRLALRAMYARQGLNATEPFERGAEAACVLVAWPVSRSAAEPWADLLWRRGCQARVLQPYGVESGRLVGNSMFNVHEIEYSWWDGATLHSMPYYAREVDVALEHCAAPYKTRPPLDVMPPPAPPPALRRRRLGAEVFLLLGLPGGASSWGVEAVLHALQPLEAQEVKDLFHPFCHEPWRPEMALVLGAPEDGSFANIWRSPRVSDPLSVVAQWVLDGTRVAVTKEVVNIGRAAQFRRLGFRAFAMYRHRRHTFPLRDEGDGMMEFCRSCFFRRMFESFMEQPLDSKVLSLVKPFLESLASSDSDRAVLLHTLAWYFLLRQGFPIMRYEVLVRGSHAELAAEFRAALGEHVRAATAVVADARGASAEQLLWQRSSAFADFVVTTRRPVGFLEEREALYGSLGVEPRVAELLRLLHAIDPSADFQLLE